MRLFSLFGVLGLAIAVAGIYGVMAYNVEQRTAEFGVRMALGASPARILAMVIARAAVLMAVGLAVGTVGAFLLSRFVGTFLFEVQPGDPRIYAGVAALLAVVGVIAALVPSLRASKVDPIVALRSQ